MVQNSDTLQLHTSLNHTVFSSHDQSFVSVVGNAEKDPEVSKKRWAAAVSRHQQPST
jgi:hypothetical protein